MKFVSTKQEPKMNSKNRYLLVDHICKSCGGRVAMQVSPSVVTGGGNPMFACTGCEQEASGSDPRAICWCGDAYNYGESKRVYTCYRIPDKQTATPEEIRALGETGFPVSKRLRQIGIVTWEAYNRIITEKSSKK